MTKLGRLVKDKKIKSVEEIFMFSLPIKEYQIVDELLGPALKDEVMKVMPVQKQTTAGQRTRFKAYVAVGDGNGHIGLGLKAAKEVATAIRGAIIHAKMVSTVAFLLFPDTSDHAVDSSLSCRTLFPCVVDTGASMPAYPTPCHRR